MRLLLSRNKLKKPRAKPPVSRNLPIEVTVLRLGHRLVRDERTSTHIGLVSRAFGAKELILTGADDDTADSIRKVSSRWGGDFAVKYVRNWRALGEKWKGSIVHLTMYGERLDAALPKIRRQIKDKMLIVIGAEKVPREIYDLATFNVAIGNQPHSEVAALAVFLDRLFMGEELNIEFVNAGIRIKASSRGKEVEVTNETRV